MKQYFQFFLIENYFQLRIPYSANVSAKYKGRTQAFSDTQNLKKYTFSLVPCLRKLLEDMPHQK